MSGERRVGTIGHIGGRSASLATMALLAASIEMSKPRSFKITSKQRDLILHEAGEPGVSGMPLRIAAAIEKQAFDNGLAAAAAFLLGTAADFEQMANRTANRKLTEHERKEIRGWQEKAQLLRGQAQHIAGLKLE